MTVARILKSRAEKKIQDVFGEDQMGIRKGTMDATGMLETIPEQTLDKDEELSSCCITWKQEFHHVNWTKLVQILKETGLDSHEKKTNKQTIRGSVC